MTGKSSRCCLEVVLSWSVQVTLQLSRRTLSTHTDKDIPWKHELLTLHECLNFVVCSMFTVHFIYASLFSPPPLLLNTFKTSKKSKASASHYSTHELYTKRDNQIKYHTTIAERYKIHLPLHGKLVCKDLGCKHLDSKLILRKMLLSEAALSTCLTHVIGTVIIVQDLSH